MQFNKAKVLAEWMHDTYECLASAFGWETQESTRVVFDNLPEKNKQTMVNVADRLIIEAKLSDEQVRNLCKHFLGGRLDGRCDKCKKLITDKNEANSI